MNNFSKEFYEHFEITKDTKNQYTFKCLESNNEFTFYKKILPDRFIVCKCCGKKIPLYDNKAYYKQKYIDTTESYFTETNSEEKKALLRKIYYYRKKAGIPSSDLPERYCRMKIAELNQRILKNELVKRTVSYKSDEYIDYKRENDRIRILFRKIKRVIPDFTDYDRFLDYKNYIIKMNPKL